VNNVFATGATTSVCIRDRSGTSVTIRAEPASHVAPTPEGRETSWFSIHVGRTPWNNSHPAIALLTRRQKDIAEAVAEGLSDQEIAQRFHISTATVHDGLTRLHTLIGTRTRSSLVAQLNRP
jgi:DNA-binding NarL/FixJ family response regulator